MRPLLAPLRRRAAQENGTVILIVAVLMTAMLGFGAYAIDIGSARAAKSEAQSGADATAEAAADYISTQEQAGDTPTNAAIVAAAEQVANANGYVNASVAVTWPYAGNDNEVQIGISGDSSTSLGNEAGRSSIPVSASAIAEVNESTSTSTSLSTSVSNSVSSTVTTGNQTVTGDVTSTETVTTTGTKTSTSATTDDSCSSAGNDCMAIFAMETGCSNDGITFGGGVAIAGGVWSNSSLDLGGGGSKFAALTYSSASGCSVTPAASIESGQSYDGDTYNDGLPVSEAAQTTWPIDYASDFPSCSGSSCSGPDGTPSYCTQASTSSSWTIDGYYPYTLVTGQIYCAVGSGTASNPLTWNGSLSVNGTSTTVDSTYVAGSITVGGGSELEACGYSLTSYTSSTCSSSAPSATDNWPLFYAVSGTINASSGGNGMTGDWFAPDGSISVGGGTDFVGFIEAQSVDLSSGGITGDGPADSGTAIGTTHTVTSTTTTTGTTTQVVTGTTTSTTKTTGTNYTTTPVTQTSTQTSTLTTPDGSALTGPALKAQGIITN